MYAVRHIPIGTIKCNPHNARTHAKRQIREIAQSIAAFGFTCPVLVDEDSVLVAGHGRLEAAKLLNVEAVPAVILVGLSPAKKRALALADNRIAQKAGWDREKLAIELPALTEILQLEGLDISVTGFETPEIDSILLDFEVNTADPADNLDDPLTKHPPVCRIGDLWILGNHRLLCGSATETPSVEMLLDGERAAAAFLDPPYNVSVRSIVGRGRTKHKEFEMASGEMSDAEFSCFLKKALTSAASVSAPGAVHFVCMDWRHIAELMSVGREVYENTLNLVVWEKSNAGQGSFYRSQHELIGVFRVGEAAHQNNVELGRHGRSRSNVWKYAGVNSFRSGRMAELSVHPTVKPVAMIADALKDCTRRGEVILDTFCGSGSTILAAERVGRRGFGIELDPHYVDVAVRRWQDFTGRDATHWKSGLTYGETRGTAKDDAHVS